MPTLRPETAGREKRPPVDSSAVLEDLHALPGRGPRALSPLLARPRPDGHNAQGRGGPLPGPHRERRAGRTTWFGALRDAVSYGMDGRPWDRADNQAPVEPAATPTKPEDFQENDTFGTTDLGTSKYLPRNPRSPGATRHANAGPKGKAPRHGPTIAPAGV